MIHFACLSCGMKFKVKDEFAGRMTKCSTCKSPVRVPDASKTMAYVPAEGIDGSESSLDQAGVNPSVTLASQSGEQPASIDALAKKQVGRYVIDKEIARGGMGAVLRGIDRDIRREVAIKFMLDDSDPKKKARFVEEAQITGQLEHPNIVPIHELGVDAKKRLFFTMKMVKGRSLDQILKSLGEPGASVPCGDFTLGRLLNILVNVCHAMAFAHSHHVIHRDLKPANLMIGDFGEVYVMDWGLAKVLGKAHEREASATVGLSVAHASVSVATSRDADLTQDGAIMGTPAYMPPEQALGKLDAIDARSDIYSLGAILYAMLTLQAPIEKGGDHIAFLLRVVEGTIKRPEVRFPERHIPPELSAIAMKALAKEPRHRYQTVEAFRRDLELFVEGRSVSAKQDTFREQAWKLVKRNKGASIASSAAMVVLMFVVGYFMTINYAARVYAESQREIAEGERNKANDNYDAFKKEQSEKDRRTKESVPAFLRAAKHLAADGAERDSLEQVDLALFYDPENADARLLRGQLLLARKDFPGGQAELERYLLKHPKDAETRKASALVAKGKADDPNVLFALAEYLQRNKLHGLAPGLLREVAQKAELRRPLLTVYQKQVEAAWPGLGRAVSLQPNGQIKAYFPFRREVTDLRPLRGMQINVLNLDNGPKVADLSPLQGMPLTYLHLQRNSNVRDIAPLRGMPLTSLNLNDAGPVEDLTPLKGMQLTYLGLAGCRVTDLTPLRGMPLEGLYLVHTPVNDLTPLKGMPIKTLNLSGTLVRDLEAVRDMPLTDLQIPNTQIQSLAPLRGMKLVELSLYQTPVRDLTPLQGMALVELEINQTSVTDLTPVKGMPLQRIGLSPKRITKGWDSLREMKTLQVVGVDQVGTYSAAEFWKRFDAGEFK